MTPDVYCDLNIINGTNQEVVIGPKKDGAYNNQYQMNSWFPENMGHMLAPMMGTNSYTLQFLRGEGDEDDGADAAFSLNGDPNLPLVHFMARSDDNSGHFFQYQLVGSLPGNTIVASSINCPDWTKIEDPTTIKWNTGTSLKKLGYGADKSGYFIIVNLDDIGVTDAQEIYKKIAGGQELTSQDAQTIYNNLLASVTPK